MKAYVEGVNMDGTHIAEMLTSAVFLVRHTTVLIMTPKRNNQEGYELQICEYIWHHPTIRPFGHKLPRQCPQCGFLMSFTSERAPKDVIKMLCDCGHVLVFNKPQGCELVKGGEGGKWMVREVTVAEGKHDA